MAPMIWSPLAGGKIFSTNGQDASSKRVQEALKTVAKQIGSSVSIDQVAYAWLLAHPVKAMPIVGSNDIGRIQVAAESMKVKLSRQQWFLVLEACTGSRVA
jgi:predicted oxidoreductase